MVVLQDFSHLNEPKRGLAMTNKSQISMRSERLPTVGLSKYASLYASRTQTWNFDNLQDKLSLMTTISKVTWQFIVGSPTNIYNIHWF